MALSAKLVMRQGQSMVMTPQLLQAIKLLQLPNVELAAYIENELERNPLLERAEDFNPSETANEPAGLFEAAAAPDGEADWASQELETDAAALAQNLGTEIDNAFDTERAAAPAALCSPPEGHGLSATSWSGVAGGSPDGLAPDLEAYAAAQVTLGDHLARQAAIVLTDPVDLMIGRALIDALDEAGYLTGPIEDLAERLGAPFARIESVLWRMQQLEPTGVFARDLAECLSLQLIERDRFDPRRRHDRRDPPPRAQARPGVRRAARASGDGGRVRVAGAR
jgi:RNA polymerase sigma-54 factor